MLIKRGTESCNNLGYRDHYNKRKNKEKGKGYRDQYAQIQFKLDCICRLIRTIGVLHTIVKHGSYESGFNVMWFGMLEAFDLLVLLGLLLFLFPV